MNMVPAWHLYMMIIITTGICLFWAISVYFPDKPKYPEVNLTEEQWQQLIQRTNAEIGPIRKPEMASKSASASKTADHLN